MKIIRLIALCFAYVSLAMDWFFDLTMEEEEKIKEKMRLRKKLSKGIEFSCVTCEEKLIVRGVTLTHSSYDPNKHAFKIRCPNCRHVNEVML